PKYRSCGNFRKSGTERYLISGAGACCAKDGTAASKSTRTHAKCFMANLLDGKDPSSTARQYTVPRIIWNLTSEQSRHIFTPTKRLNREPRLRYGGDPWRIRQSRDIIQSACASSCPARSSENHTFIRDASTQV